MIGAPKNLQVPNFAKNSIWNPPGFHLEIQLNSFDGVLLLLQSIFYELIQGRNNGMAWGRDTSSLKESQKRKVRRLLKETGYLSSSNGSIQYF